jgi:hypothetical protein
VGVPRKTLARAIIDCLAPYTLRPGNVITCCEMFAAIDMLFVVSGRSAAGMAGADSGEAWWGN